MAAADHFPERFVARRRLRIGGGRMQARRRATACEEGGAAPAVLNAANEIAVAAFLDRKIPFSRIALLVEDVLNQGELPEAPRTLEDVLRVDEDARSRATRILEPA